MASSPPPPKKSSGWGSFLQQAVAGVESRLDTILADEDDQGSRNTKLPGKAAEQPGLQASMPVSPQRGSKGPSRSSSTAKANDRLQERLARAMAQKNSSVRTGSPASSAGNISRAATPVLGQDSPRSSFESPPSQADLGSKETTKVVGEAVLLPAESEEVPEDQEHTPLSQRTELSPAIVFAPASSDSLASSQVQTPARGSLESSREEEAAVEKSTPDITVNGSLISGSEEYSEYEIAMAQLKAEHEAAELRWQEELHGYVERLDALQSKLQYLTTEAKESAKQVIATASAGSLEKKISEKDMQIALLMEEGQKLSKTELKHMNTIKKIRSQLTASERAKAEMKARAEKAEKEFANTEDRLKRAEASEKRGSERSNQLTKVERDFETLSTERTALHSTIADLKAQLARATARAEAVESKAQNDASESEKRQITDLKDDLTSSKIERELSEEKLRREIRDLKESVEREKEKSRVQEIELRGELSVLESKLETLRVRAEEVSSGATGDAQAKLLRQIETLQTQYSVASENWQGIEGSLMSRLATVETERDDIAKREGELRKKSREANIKAKKAATDLDFSRERLEDLDRNLSQQQEEIKRLHSQLQASSQEVSDLKKDMSQRQETWESTVTQRIEDEKSKWLQGYNSRVDSPVTSLRKPSDFTLLPVGRYGHGSGVFADSTGSISDRPPSRRPSFNPLFSERGTPPRQGSTPSLHQLSMNGPNPNSQIPETPSIHTHDPSEDFFGLETPVTPASPGTHRSSHTPHINDLISTSTIAVSAGPSVQLVERMSATVRRLESERAGAKDELTRLTAQRDEARQEVVELMREVETKRKGDERIEKLEAEVKELNDRYLASLEMLGEKSEEVEELKADVSDVKRIYRELVDSTMK